MDKKRNLMDIPIDEIDVDNLPSDEELETLGPLEPINANRDEFFGKVVFPNDRQLKKDGTDEKKT